MIPVAGAAAIIAAHKSESANPGQLMIGVHAVTPKLTVVPMYCNTSCIERYQPSSVILKIPSISELTHSSIGFLTSLPNLISSCHTGNNFSIRTHNSLCCLKGITIVFWAAEVESVPSTKETVNPSSETTGTSNG